MPAPRAALAALLAAGAAAALLWLLGGGGAPTREPQQGYWERARIAPCQRRRVFGGGELARAATRGELLLLIRGLVLNVTAYAAHHPGGAAILEGVGKDATQLFQKHHLPHIAAVFTHYCVGTIAGAAAQPVY
eukprot:TRINITY_DN33537_c0_g1_i1.p3 TRINITY_DN33537_c0_g1~~TRINITY_DN33537_c0_g1_i1.p3  ORF type:complete len:133 (+),score=47.37 TRINITY_DN33537_c0_g1_i1:64-462(+)